MEPQGGFEPPPDGVEDRCPIQLGDWGKRGSRERSRTTPIGVKARCTADIRRGYGTLGATRTRSLPLRGRTLDPSELQGHMATLAGLEPAIFG